MFSKIEKMGMKSKNVYENKKMRKKNVHVRSMGFQPLIYGLARSFSNHSTSKSFKIK
jgi:hypothetical protein